jgi:hypothetical protein
MNTESETQESPPAGNTVSYAGKIGAAGAAVKSGIVNSLRGIDEIEAEIVSLVRDTISNSIKTSGALSTETVAMVHDVVQGAISATEVGADWCWRPRA